MSRIGKKELTIPQGITVTIGDNISVKGPKGELSMPVVGEVTVKIDGDKISSVVNRNDKFSKSIWGTTMSKINSMITGVSVGWTKNLIIEGVGFKWEVKGDKLQLNVGFSHPVLLDIPKGLDVKTEKLTLSISGIDRELVTLFAMQIKKIKKPEPYKGKGIRYEGEVIRRKEGKKSA